jgi:CheY-like chemotaxis protein
MVPRPSELLKAGKFELLLTDIDMPIMDGIALALAGQPRLSQAADRHHVQAASTRIERARGPERDDRVRVISKPFSRSRGSAEVRGRRGGRRPPQAGSKPA